MRLLPGMFLTLWAAGPAQASGGLSCEAEGSNVSLRFDGGVTRGMGGPLFSFSGSVQIATKAVESDLRKVSLGLGNVAQYWLDGKELRLVLYREREGDRPHGYVEITVLAEGDGDEATYRGTFALTAYDTAGNRERTHAAEGQVTCFVE